ncbi:MAG: hypothetical protein J7M25_10000 [Deltaproteobacteria bacterium]|nr:hypothetical protein [Deltaproteobacteria bacterium]
MKRTSVILGLVLATSLAAGCRRKSTHKKQPAKSKPAKPATPRPRPGVAPQATTSLLGTLPAEADAVLYVNVATVTATPQWAMVTTLLQAVPDVQRISKDCGITFTDLPKQFGIAVRFDSADAMFVATGISSAKVMACVQKETKRAHIQTLKAQVQGKPTIAIPLGGKLGTGILMAISPTKLVLATGSWQKISLAPGKAHLDAKSTIAQLAGRLKANVLWFASLGFPTPLKAHLPHVNAIAQTKSLAFGINYVKNQIMLSLLADMRTNKSASDIADVLKRYLPGLDRYSPRLKPLKPIFSKLKIRAEAQYLRVTITLSPQELAQLAMLAKGLAPIHVP